MVFTVLHVHTKFKAADNFDRILATDRQTDRRYPTGSFTVLEPPDQEIGEFEWLRKVTRQILKVETCEKRVGRIGETDSTTFKVKGIQSEQKHMLPDQLELSKTLP